MNIRNQNKSCASFVRNFCQLVCFSLLQKVRSAIGSKAFFLALANNYTHIPLYSIITISFTPHNKTSQKADGKRNKLCSEIAFEVAF